MQTIDWMLIGVIGSSLLAAVGFWSWEAGSPRRKRAGRFTQRKRQKLKPEPLERANEELEGSFLLGEGERSIKAQETQKAQSFLTSALRTFQRINAASLIGQTRYRLALCYWAEGEVDLALQTLEPLLQLPCIFPLGYLCLARLYEVKKQFERAERVLTQLPQRCPQEEILGLPSWLSLLREAGYRKDALRFAQEAERVIFLQQIPAVEATLSEGLARYGLDSLFLVANAHPHDLAFIPDLDPPQALQLIQSARDCLTKPLRVT